MKLTLELRFSLPELDISRHVADDHPAGQGVHVTCHFPDLRALLEHGRQRAVVLIVVLGRLDTNFSIENDSLFCSFTALINRSFFKEKRFTFWSFLCVSFS
jgi:hypothetical protein